MNEDHSLAWAKSNDAHVQEPTDTLKQRGWAYGDIPAASNFNWLFKKISEEFDGVKKDLLTQKAEAEKQYAVIAGLKDKVMALSSSLGQANEQISQANNELSGQKNELKLNKAEISKVKKSHEALKAESENNFYRTFSNDEFNESISSQICGILSHMEQVLRQYHPTFPKFHWPLRGHILTAHETEENNNG